MPFQVNAGLHYKRLFPGRDDDRTVLHFIYGHLSDDYARSVHVPGQPLCGFREGAGSRASVSGDQWSHFQPYLEDVSIPAAPVIPNAIVIGAQMGVTL